MLGKSTTRESHLGHTYIWLINLCLISGGLKPTGSASGDCASSSGQVYARATTHNDRYAIMYSWYMPKTEASTLIGHRHDWQHAVVWFSNGGTSGPNVLGMAVSQNGAYETTTAPSVADSHPLIAYKSSWPNVHELLLDTEVGATQPLVAWESLSDAARNALNTADFGDATVPFKDENFTTNIEKAAF
jgi:hypothetical protein